MGEIRLTTNRKSHLSPKGGTGRGQGIATIFFPLKNKSDEQ